MSFNAGNLISTLSLNYNAFVQGLNSAQSTARAAASLIQSEFTRIDTRAQTAAQGVNKLGMSFKDVGRMVSGILISQFFYRMLGSIERSTSAVIDFAMEMEKAQLAFTRMLGSAERATGFINVMKDFAAVTDFTTGQVLEMSRRLMAMGFEATQVRSVMQIVGDQVSLLGGGAEKLDRIVYALGQIKNSAKLAQPEVRQLTEAGVNATKYLKDAFKLTNEQTQNLGKQGIKGADAVAAILKGMQKDSAGMTAILANSMKGMITTIKDDLLLVSEQAINPLFNTFKTYIKAIRDALEAMRGILRDSGIGGLLNEMFSSATAENIRIIVASLGVLGNAILTLGKALTPVISIIAGAFTQNIALLLPIFSRLAQAISYVIYALVTYVPAIRYAAAALTGLLITNFVARSFMFLFSVLRLGAIFSFVAQMVEKLTTAIRVLWLAISSHSILLVVTLLAGGLLYLAASSGILTNALSGMSKALSGLMGMNTSGILQPVDNKTKDSMNEFNQLYQSTSDATKELGNDMEDTANKGAKAGKKIKDKFLASFDEVFQIPDAMSAIGDEMPKLAGDFKLDPLTDLSMGDLGGGLGGGLDLPDLNLDSMLGGVTDVLAKLGKIIGDFFTVTLPSAASEFFFNILPNFLSMAGSFITKAILGIDKLITTGAWTTPLKVGLDAFTGWVASWAPKPVSTAVKVVADVIKTSLDGFAGLLSQVHLFNKGIVQYLISLGPKLAPIIQGIWSVLSTVGSGIAGAVTQTVQSIAQKLTAFWQKWGADIVGFFQNTFILIQTLIGGAFEGVKTVVAGVLEGINVFIATWGKDIVDLIKGVFELASLVLGPILDVLYKLVVSVIDSIGNDIKKIFNGLKAFWNAWGPSIIAVLKAVWDNIKTIFGAALDIILNNVGSAFRVLNNIVQAAIAILKGDWSDAWEHIKTVFITIWEAIKTNFSIVWEAIKTVAKNVTSALATVFSEVWKKIKSAASEAWDGIVKYFVGLKDSITSAFTSATSGIATVFSTLWAGTKKSFLGFVNVMIEGINYLIGSLNKLQVKTPDWIPDWMGGGKQWGVNIKPIPPLANGGIVQRETLARIGEGNKREAVIPLQNNSAMAPFVKAVAEELKGLFVGTTTDAPNYYMIGTLIGDNQSLTELERRLNVVRLNENSRRGFA